MDPQNFGPDCILRRNLKVLLQQIFNSLSQVSVAACSSLSQPAPYASFLDSVATKFPWSRQYLFLQHIYFVATDLFWLFNNLSYKVYRSIHFMSRQSYVCLL